jgi:carbamoylphosphate synthase small subunit
VPDKFVASGIIAKLPSSWRDFATSLKHKRQEFNMVEVIGSLDVEERARVKDMRGKGVESSSANMVQKKNSNTSHNKKNKQENNSKPKQTTTFKKKRTTKMVVALLARLKEKPLGMVILYLLFF